MKKRLISVIFTLMVFMLPLVANADSISLSCNDTSLKQGGSTTCTLKGTTSNSVAGADFTVSSSSGLSIESVTKDSSWEGSVDGKHISVYTSNNKTGTFNIATIKVKTTSSATGDLTLSVSKGDFTDGSTFDTLSISGTSKTIHIKSSEAILSTLSVDGMTLSPAFSSSTYSYTLPETTASSITINATATSSGAKVTGTGKKNLDYGDNTITIKVTGETGTVTKYTIKVKRTDNRDTVNTLSALSVEGYSITPAFSESTKTYSLTVPSNITSVNVKATLTSSKSSFVNKYGQRSVTLKYGKNEVKVQVKAENEKVNTYTINITRTDDRDSNNYLKSLSITNGDITFKKDTTTYKFNVDETVTKIKIEAEAESDKATIKGIGEKKLKDGKNTFKVVVTAENTKTKTYTIIVNKASKDKEVVEEEDAIKKLTIKNSSITFNPDVFEYSVKIGKDVNSLEFDYETSNDVKIIIEGNENLLTGSVVVLKATKNKETVEYSFNIVKEKEEENATVVGNDTKDDDTEDPESKSNDIILYIIIGLGAFVVIGLLIALLGRKKKNPADIDAVDLSEAQTRYVPPVTPIDTPFNQVQTNQPTIVPRTEENTVSTVVPPVMEEPQKTEMHFEQTKNDSTYGPIPTDANIEKLSFEEINEVKEPPKSEEIESLDFSTPEEKKEEFERLDI